MKTAIIFFLLGAIAGGYAMHVYMQPSATAVAAPAPAPTQPGQFSADVNQKLEQWHLTPDDIRSDLDKTGQVVRAKAAEAGGKIADARIIAIIKAKYVLDRDLSARDIDVHVDDGHVRLSGTVPSDALIGKAVMLALDTDGVRSVSSTLRSQP